MKLAVCIPVLNQPESTQTTLEALKRLQKHDNRYIVIDNGSEPKVRDWLTGLNEGDMVIKNPKNKGLPKAINQGMFYNERHIGADYVFNTHTDVEMFEQDWDEKTIQAIEGAGNVGVAGYFGALGIGTGGIYVSPYHMSQLARTHPISGDRCKLDPKVHGQIVFGEPWRKCAVLDGFSLIVEKDLRFETKFGPHHNYDNDICLQSIDAGKQNIVINMDVNHHGGKTDVGEDWATPFGKSKAQIHADAHPPFYEKWRKLLPYTI